MGALGRHWRARSITEPILAIALCTHNPRRDFLDRTLASLRQQSLPLARWELLLVDNASTNDVVATTDLTWHPRASVVHESRVGLTNARLRAIAETSTELLLFVDDDNVLVPDYADTVVSLAGRYPNLGCFGAGRLEPEFEEEPRDELRPYLRMLALRSVPHAQWSNNPLDDAMPWGAGIAMRRRVAAAYSTATTANPLRRELGRSGAQLNSGEDDEFSWVACRLGQGKGLFPEMQITHLIDRRRVQLDYLLSLAEGHAYSAAILDYLHGIPVPAPAAVPTASRALKQLFQLHPRGAVEAARGAWSQSRRPAIHRAFDSAMRSGRQRGLQVTAGLASEPS